MGFRNKLIKKYKYDNFKEFMDHVVLPTGKLGREFLQGEFVFRGENSNEYDLIPKALRKLNAEESNLMCFYNGNLKKATNFIEQIQYEKAIINRFSKYANQQGLQLAVPINDYIVSLSTTFAYIEEKGLWPPKQEIELFSLAQHYGIPTRLLDFTFDLNVALYFASQKVSEAKYIRLYALRTTELQKFDDKICFHVPQYAHNPNLHAQKGVMVYVSHFYDLSNKKEIMPNISEKPLDYYLVSHLTRPGVVIKPYLYIIDINVQMLDNIKSYLFNNGYNYSRLFPGYGSIKETIMQENKIKFNI